MISSQVKYSVIIPVYNDWQRLQQCLIALQNQSFPRENFEILIVNNDPKGDFPTDFNFPVNSRLLHQPVPGSYSARNLGVKESIGGLLAFTDSDCIPDRNWLRNAEDYFKDYQVPRIGGEVILFFKDENKRTNAELYESVFAFDQKGNVVDKGFSVTANLIVKRECFLKTGYFDATKFSGEDHGWNKRASKLGYKIAYAENVIVKHPARRKLKSLIEKKTRVIGGYNSPTKVGGIMLYFGYIVKRYFFGFMITTLKQKNLSLEEKMRVIGVIVVLFGVHLKEYTRLIFGGQPENK